MHDYLRGVKIGARLMRARSLYHKHELSDPDVALLEARGIVWKVNATGDPNWHLILAEGLRVYESNFGDTLIRDFKVETNDDTWPAHLRGINLSHKLSRSYSPVDLFVHVPI